MFHDPNQDALPTSQDTLPNYQLVFDAVYTPRKTRLLKEAENAGAIIVSGVEMFLRQAIAQFNLFTDGQGATSFSLLQLPTLPPFSFVSCASHRALID